MKYPEDRIKYFSFDGGVAIETNYRKPDRYSFFGSTPAEDFQIPRGAGLSYTPASFSKNAKTVDHSQFNRILSFQPDTGEIEVESGITLGELEEFLTPKGFYLSVQPGHPKITVGGCIAADVHGKNQYLDGTFISRVKSLQLFHPDHGMLTLDETQNADLFRLTCGGYGLTGNILSARLALTPIKSAYVETKRTPIPDAACMRKMLENAADRAELLYTWQDFTLSGDAFGRGFLIEGKFGSADAAKALKVRRLNNSKLSSATRGAFGMSFFNSLTVPLFNRMYYRVQSISRTDKLLPLYDFLFPVHDKEIYFKLFGAAGFMEYQILIPFDTFDEFINVLKRKLQSRRQPIVLASAKLFSGAQDLLRFRGRGICLAMNFPRSNSGLEFARFLDDTTLALRAIPNIIKDSRLPAEVAEKAFPQYELFRDSLRRHDPKRLYRSALSERLRL